MARKPYNSNQKTFTQKMRSNKLSLGWYIFIAHHVFIRMGISAASVRLHWPASGTSKKNGPRDIPVSRQLFAVIE
jgi:hypothetical protein